MMIDIICKVDYQSQPNLLDLCRLFGSNIEFTTHCLLSNKQIPHGIL